MTSVATKIFQKNQVAGNGLVAVPFKFSPNGTGVPDATLTVGPGVTSVVYLSANMFQVNLRCNFKQLVAASFSIYAAAAGTAQGFTIEVDTANTNVAAGIVALATVNAAGTRATIAAATDQRISGILWFSTSAVL